MKKRQLGSCVTFFPQPITLISTVGADGGWDFMAASWAGIVSKTPPTMAVSLNRERKTYAQIQETGCFVVNMVPAELAVEADYCGLKSGREADKLAVTGLTTETAEQVTAPLLKECPLNVECKVSGEMEIGDYRLVTGEILQVHAIESAFDEQGKMDARVFNPLVYFGGIREYWNLGEKVADAYRDGTRLF